MKIIPLVLFLWFSTVSISQIGQVGVFVGATQTVSYDNEQLSVFQTAMFNLGFNELCPNYEYYSFTILNNNIQLNVAYSVLGVWPSFYCERTDTFTLNIPPGLYNLSVCVEILNVDINTQEPITTSAGCNTSFNIVLGNYEDVENIDNSIFTFVNPTSSQISIYTLNDLEIHEVQIIDYQGRVLKKEVYDLSSIDVSFVASGYYFLKSATNKGMLIRKIYISHL